MKWFWKRLALFALGALRKVVRLSAVESAAWDAVVAVIEEL